MTHATIRFQYDTARFELYLDTCSEYPQAVQADAFRTVEQPDSH